MIHFKTGLVLQQSRHKAQKTYNMADRLHIQYLKKDMKLFSFSQTIHA